MMRPHRKKNRAVTRDPERTRGRILAAAIAEFAAKGLAGARVDAIARRAGSNKRMLYHYFDDKEGLFRAVLRWKIGERQAVIDGAPGDPTENLPFRFEMMCGDLEWIRLLGWESLHHTEDKLEEEKLRRKGIARALQRVRRGQSAGLLRADFEVRHLLLAKLSLAMFPAAFPHITRLIMGRPVRDAKFQREYKAFLKKFAVAFQPRRSTGK